MSGSDFKPEGIACTAAMTITAPGVMREFYRQFVEYVDGHRFSESTLQSEELARNCMAVGMSMAVQRQKGGAEMAQSLISRWMPVIGKGPAAQSLRRVHRVR